MNAALIALAWVAWVAAGVASFVYWWTRERDLTTSELFVALATGLMGPFNFLAGWMVMGEGKRPPRVLMSRRSRR